MGFHISVRLSVDERLDDDQLDIFESELGKCVSAALDAALKSSTLKPHLGEVTSSADTLIDQNSTNIEAFAHD